METLDSAEMGLVARTNEHTISKMEGGRGDGKVIGRNQATLPAGC